MSDVSLVSKLRTMIFKNNGVRSVVTATHRSTATRGGESEKGSQARGDAELLLEAGGELRRHGHGQRQLT